MNDDKLSILDPRRNCKCYKGIRLKICKALEFVKDKFNIFKNKSNDFSGWRYEVAKEYGLKGRCWLFFMPSILFMLMHDYFISLAYA